MSGKWVAKHAGGYDPNTWRPSFLARLLVLEGLCERCHQSMATEIFDRTFVCSPCRRILEEKLVNDG